MDVPDFVCYLTVLPGGWDEKTLETLVFQASWLSALAKEVVEPVSFLILSY
jgi:hypothetical protein